MSALAPLHVGVYVPSATPSSRKTAIRPPAGDAPSVDTFERIVDDYQRRLYGFALRMTGNREDAEEIVQDAFVRAYRALGKMLPEQRADLRLQPWLYTITLNVTRNRLRSKRPANVALDALADPDALLRGSSEGPAQPEKIVEQNTEVALVESALLQLPMHLRAAATLRFIEGRSHPEIAEILNQPIGTVKSHVHRAVRILRRILARKSDDLPPKEFPPMRCRDVDALWDELRGDCQASLKQTVHTHLTACPSCQGAYLQNEGVAYCLSCLPKPEPSCDLTKKVIEHIASLHGKAFSPIVVCSVATPVGQLYAGVSGTRIAYVSLDTGNGLEEVLSRAERRLRRRVVPGEAPVWLVRALERFFSTWTIDDTIVDISGLTPFEQDVLRAAASIPPGEVRSYAWVATQVGRPKAARAVGRVMARNPLPLLFPCHRVVDSSGQLHNYFYGVEVKARLLRMEGYRR